MDATRVSLINRVKSATDARAWEEFYETYWGVIVRYAHKLGLKDAAAQDVLQETMIALMRSMPDFQYDESRGRFRNFVLTIAHRKVLAAFRRAATSREVSLDETQGSDDTPMIDELSAPPGETVETRDESRWQESIYEEALARVRRDPSILPSTFDIFQAYVAEGLSADEVASKYRVNKNTVYQIKNRLMKRIAEEVEHLQEA